ncbi:unnamed protein product [Scytosiphon promiscuus]
MSAARAVLRSVGWRRALLEARSARGGGGRGGGGGAQHRPFSSLSVMANFHQQPRYTSMAMVAAAGGCALVLSQLKNLEDLVPTFLSEMLQQQHSSTTALARIEEFYDVETDEAATLGEGQFGTVSTATDKATGEVVAVKCVPRSKASEAHFRQEADVHREVANHPNVVGLKGIFADEDNFYMVMELAAGGELFERLTTEGQELEEREVLSLLRDTANAIAYLHDHSIVHGDVKPENMLLTAPATAAAAAAAGITHHSAGLGAGTGRPSSSGGYASPKESHAVLLADFGSSFRVRRSGGDGGGGDAKSTVKEYTVAYSAPEVVENSPAVDQKADVWSLGVIAYVMVKGHHPFDPTSDADDDEIADNILNDDPDWDGLEPKAATLIRQMLSRDPKDRPSAREVLQNSWLQQLQ